MPLTRAALESVIVGRFAGRMKAVGLDGVTVNGTNADLADPIAGAIRGMGYPLADDTRPTDADLAPIVGPQIDRLADLAGLAILYKILGQWAEVDEKAGGDEQRLSQFADQVRAQITLLEDRLKKPYGPTLGGSSLSTMDRGRHIPNDPFALPRSYSPPWRWPYP